MATPKKATTRRRAPAKPVAVVEHLVGKKASEIAEMIVSGEVAESGAEAFVANRAVGKLRKEIAKLLQA